jgi:aryl-alcohol dehydrogenase-like predicted oxidoreductase
METRDLGTQGLTVSALGLGCMGMSWGYGAADEAEAVATIRRALDLGITFFDTAEIYGPYVNEQLLGRALDADRTSVVVATKFGFRIDADGKMSGVDSSPANVRRACDASLERLGTDYIDLFYQHRVDPAVPIEDTVGAMAQLVQDGKVRFLGLSEASARTLERANRVHPISALQSEYSLFERGIEADVLPTCRRLGIGLVPYSPLGRGLLTGTLRQAQAVQAEGDFRSAHPRFQGENFERNLRLVATLGVIADRHGASPSQVALAWLLWQGEDIVPIPGTKRRRWLEENVGAAQLSLTDADLEELERQFAPGAAAGERYAPAMMRYLDRSGAD